MKQDLKKTGFCYRHRYAFTFFLFTVLYHVLIVNRLELWKVSEISYTYHIVDYKSLGFRSQLLPGSIFYGLFGERASVTAASVFNTALILLFFAGVALFLEKFILGVEERRRQTAFILILFYLTGPYTFAIFTDELGMLDVYWLFFSLIFFFVLDKKGLRFLIPILFVLSLLIHFSSVLNYLILFSILLLYKISLETEKKKQIPYAIVFTLSLVTTAGLFLYFLLNHTGNLPLSQEDFHQLVLSRGGTYTGYYDYSLYYDLHGEDVIPPSVAAVDSPLVRMLQTVFYKCVFTFKSYAKVPPATLARFALAVILLTPATAVIYKQLFRFYKSILHDPLKRFCIFLVMVQFPFTAVLGCLFSPDTTRWCTHAFLIFFTLLLYISYHEDALKAGVLEAIETYRNAFPALVYFIAYFLAHAWAYC